MAEPIRDAVVGTGFGTRIHVAGFRLSGRLEVVALVGRDRERTAKIGARLEVLWATTSFDEVLAIAPWYEIPHDLPQDAEYPSAV